MRTIADFYRAKTLYDIDRYAECMDLIDQLIGIPHDARFEKIPNILRKDWNAESNASQFKNSYQNGERETLLVATELNEATDTRPIGVVKLVDLMELRSRCLSAIFFSADADLKERYQNSVLLNVYIIFELIPLESRGAPDVWRLAAQSLLHFKGHTGQAISMIVAAIKSLESDAPAKGVLDMASSTDFSPERHLLATTIPRIVAGYNCGDDVKRQVAELRVLVNPKKSQPKLVFGSWLLVAAMVAIAIVGGLATLNSALNSTFEKISRDLGGPSH